MARERIADFYTMNINFYPRESRLITFRDPWSFPVLFHPGCNNLIRRHLEELAQKVRYTLRACQLGLLTLNKGRLSLRFPGRIPCDSVLSAPVSNSRSRSYVLSLGAFHSK